jgi:3-oxoacyl-(acyl-carrier-protein) synthase
MKAMYSEDSVMLTTLDVPQRAYVLKSVIDNHKNITNNNGDILKFIRNELFTKDEIKKINTKTKNKIKGLFFAGGAVEFAGHGSNLSNLLEFPNPIFPRKGLFQNFANVEAGQVANLTNFYDKISTDGTTCISSFKAIYDAYINLKLKKVDLALAVGYESVLNPMIFEIFDTMDVTVSRQKERNGLLPSAFDKNNNGFNIGQGAGYMLLQRKKPKGDYVAKILAIDIAGERNQNPIGQSLKGNGYISAIKNCLKEAKLNPSDIDFIKTHGSGTLLNNISEDYAIRSIFKDDFIATSYKQYIGHTFSAMAFAELDIALKDSANGFIRPILNRTEEDDKFINKKVYKNDIEHILLLGSGLGNVFTAMIVQLPRKN